VAKALGIGITTSRRREGTVYPLPARIGGITVYRREDLQALQALAERVQSPVAEEGITSIRCGSGQD
jgi:hypothetical protein